MSFTSVCEKRSQKGWRQLFSAVFVHQFGQHLLKLQPGHVKHGVPATGTSGSLQGRVTSRARSHVAVSGAAFGRTAALDEGSSGVRVLLRLQRGRGEDVGGETSELVGARTRVWPVIVRLKRKQKERALKLSEPSEGFVFVTLKASPQSHAVRRTPNTQEREEQSLSVHRPTMGCLETSFHKRQSLKRFFISLRASLFLRGCLFDVDPPLEIQHMCPCTRQWAGRIGHKMPLLV